jgi:hypothetical protein
MGSGGTSSLDRRPIYLDRRMSAAGASSPRLQAALRAVRGWVDANPAAAAIVVYALVAMAAFVAAYFALFTQFAFYDDEGTLLVTVKAFAHGQVLYRDIYSPYGPFYYDLFGGLFALTGWAVTNDASRLIVSVVWVGSSLLFGLASQRLSGRLILGAAGMVVAFAALGVLAAEPMHPQGLAVLLLAGITLSVVLGPARRAGLAGGFSGALLGALLLTKVNLGTYASVAAVLAAVLTFEPLYRRRWLRWPAIAALLALPLIVMAGDLREQWVRDLIVLEFLSVTAVVIAASSAAPPIGERDAAFSRWLLGAAIGAIATVVVLLAFLLLTGPDPSEAFDGIVKEGLKLRDVFTIPLTYPAVAVDWGILAVAAATLVTLLRSKRAQETVWPGLLRLLAGVAIWFTLAGSSPLSFGPTGNRLALPLALAWVAALAPLGAGEPAFRRFARALLPLLAVEQTLQVYPVAGSQIGIASVTFVAVGAICISDGLRQLRTWAAMRGWGAPSFAAATTTAGVALVAILGFHSIAGSAASNIVAYDERQSLPLPGGNLLHLAPPQGKEFAELVELLHEHRCTTFIGFPNLDSLYLFSGIEPPKPNAPGAWPIVLPLDQQQKAVDQMRASPRPCAIRNDGLADGAWLHGTPPDESDPLVNYIFNDFRTVDTVGEFQFMVAKQGS